MVLYWKLCFLLPALLVPTGSRCGSVSLVVENATHSLGLWTSHLCEGSLGLRAPPLSWYIGDSAGPGLQAPSVISLLLMATTHSMLSEVSSMPHLGSACTTVFTVMVWAWAGVIMMLWLCIYVSNGHFKNTSLPLCQHVCNKSALSPVFNSVGAGIFLLPLQEDTSRSQCESCSPTLLLLSCEQGLQHALKCICILHLFFPTPTFFAHSNALTFRCPNVWIFQLCLYVEHRILCWIIVVQLLESLRGDTEGSSYSAVILTSLLTNIILYFLNQEPRRTTWGKSVFFMSLLIILILWSINLSHLFYFSYFNSNTSCSYYLLNIYHTIWYVILFHPCQLVPEYKDGYFKKYIYYSLFPYFVFHWLCIIGLTHW